MFATEGKSVLKNSVPMYRNGNGMQIHYNYSALFRLD